MRNLRMLTWTSNVPSEVKQSHKIAPEENEVFLQHLQDLVSHTVTVPSDSPTANRVLTASQLPKATAVTA